MLDAISKPDQRIKSHGKTYTRKMITKTVICGTKKN
jgi:hypothetical protein